VTEDARSDVFAAYATQTIRSVTGTPDGDRVRGCVSALRPGASRWKRSPDASVIRPVIQTGAVAMDGICGAVQQR
jgi:hypothetical protein